MTFENLIGTKEECENKQEGKKPDNFPYFYMKNKEVNEITDQEVRPVMEDLDKLISDAWDKEKPDIDIVEKKLL